MTHPKLTTAIEQLRSGENPGAIIGIALRARMDADEHGIYCECAQPEVEGDDLLCGECLHNNRVQELKLLYRYYGPHDFVPGKLGGHMCAVCVYPETEPRHHGVPHFATTSWGQRLSPAEVLAIGEQQ